MEIQIAGGCGEHGRNAFLVKAEGLSFLVDCGLKAWAEQPYPFLSIEAIKALDYCFITHSHNDHSGALNWLLSHGFQGPVFLTDETLRQLVSNLPNTLVLSKTVSDGSIELRPDLRISWGKAGHSPGSIWYHFDVQGKRILVSGDYNEYSEVYHCDKISGLTADVAFIDTAYGLYDEPSTVMRRNFLQETSRLIEENNTILFPVPKDGRALDMILSLQRLFPQRQLQIDLQLRQSIERLDDMLPWLKAEAVQVLKQGSYERINLSVTPQALVFITDPQFKHASSHTLADLITANGGIIIFSGHVSESSPGQRVLQQENAFQFRFPVHCSAKDVSLVESRNTFKRIIRYHSEAFPNPELIRL